jgi:hypothetical protein
MTTSNYLLREALVSAVINGLISTGFFFAFFRGVPSIPVWGSDGYAFDFVPQSFAVSLMSALVPGFLARKGIAAGRFGEREIPTAGWIVLRGIGWAIGGLVAGVTVAVSVLWLGSFEMIPATPGLCVKIVFGALLGALVTHRSVSRLVG